MSKDRGPLETPFIIEPPVQAARFVTAQIKAPPQDCSTAHSIRWYASAPICPIFIVRLHPLPQTHHSSSSRFADGGSRSVEHAYCLNTRNLYEKKNIATADHSASSREHNFLSTHQCFCTGCVDRAHYHRNCLLYRWPKT